MTTRREVIAAWLAEVASFRVVHEPTQAGYLLQADLLLERIDGVRLWTLNDIADWTGRATSTLSAYHTRGQMPAPTLTYGRTHLWEPDVIKKWRPR